MNTVHTLREYVDALRAAGILTGCTASEALRGRGVECLTYDTRTLRENALFICKGAHFKEEYLRDAISRAASALFSGLSTRMPALRSASIYSFNV